MIEIEEPSAVARRGVAAGAALRRRATVRVGSMDITVAVALVGAVLIGAVVRATYVLGADFPLNDGGMFVAMVGDLQRAHFLLPRTTTYNRAGLPFAYPPLGFYVAAFLHVVTHVSVFDLLRFIPLGVSVLTVGAFALLSRSFLAAAPAVIATYAYALHPISYRWLIMGGGLTRSFGALFALLALACGYRALTTGSARNVVLAGLFCGLVVVSHLEWAWFTAYSMALFVVMRARDRTAWRNAGFIALLAATVSAPWWLTLGLRFGPGFLLHAAQSGDPWFLGAVMLAMLTISNEPAFPLIGAFGLLGLLQGIGTRRYLLPTWLVVVCLFQFRAADQRVVVPLALLAGIGVVDVIVPILVRTRRTALATMADHAQQPASVDPAPPSPYLRRSVMMTMLALFTYLFVAALLADRNGPLTALPSGERAAMAWAAQETPANATFVVVSGSRWWVDATAEWFPELAQRRSENTVQGQEWRPRFFDRINANAALQACALRGSVHCLTTWAQTWNQPLDYLFVARPPSSPLGAPATCCSDLARRLSANPHFRVLFENDAAALFQAR